MSEFGVIRNEIKNCRYCEKTFGFVPHPMVFGNENSKIFQLSQAPSRNVHMTQKPFDDLSGKRLKYGWYQITDEIFYNPDNFYITALGHCYPGKLESGNDRLPPKICAEKWLKKELDVVKSEIYIVIGRYAAKHIFPGRDYNELIFSDHTLNQKLCIVLPHPSPLNVRWFKEHPEFEGNRIREVRDHVRKALRMERIIVGCGGSNPRG